MLYIDTEPFALFQHSVRDYMCFTVMMTDEEKDTYEDPVYVYNMLHEN